MLLVTLKLIYPIVLLLTLMVSNSQEPTFSMIIKSFATITLTSEIDSLFVKTLPKAVK
mgnify:CR=1 FL=1|jgi:hypothetical protein